jgi:hypothetical protein
MIYLPILKTRDAKLRGVCNLSNDVKASITPLFELTKSRKTPKTPDGPIIKRLNTINHDYGTTPIGLDLTSSTILVNKEISALNNNDHGFQNWTNFLQQQKKSFPSLIPVLLISDVGMRMENEYIEAHRQEIENLKKIFEKFIYRIPETYEALDFDLDNLFESHTMPIVLLDMEFIPKDRGKDYAQQAIPKLQIILKHNIQEIILSGSSYPSHPAENNTSNNTLNVEKGENRLEEVIMFQECKKEYKNLIYSDYASLYPLPNEHAGGRGWIPRIDFPTRDSIIYYRRKKREGEQNYIPAYTDVARAVVKDKQFIELQEIIGDDCWGIQQIDYAASGSPPGMTPAFWISVRINLHMTLRQQLLNH